MTNQSKILEVTPEVSRALMLDQPVVALESTVITHGLPHPQNEALALEMEATVRANHAIPATIAVLDGRIHVGLTKDQISKAAGEENPLKVSVRDFGPALAKKLTGGTTVAATSFAANLAGIRVFATGGIGGVHHEPAFDISADLEQLAKTPMIVVCAGAKAILDLPATLEYLETSGVVVLGFQTDEFPAFYSPHSGLSVPHRADTPDEVADIARHHWRLGLKSAVLVVVPPPADTALPKEVMDIAIQSALKSARESGLRGQEISPFLLAKVSELTNEDSLKANLALLKNNAKVAAQISGKMAKPRRMGMI